MARLLERQRSVFALKVPPNHVLTSLSGNRLGLISQIDSKLLGWGLWGDSVGLTAPLWRLRW